MEKYRRLMEMKRKFSLKTVLVLICIAIFATSFLGYVLSSGGVGAGRDLYLDDLPSTASFVVSTDGTYVWATRYDGYVAYGGSADRGGVDGTNASAVINAALGNLTSERTSKEKVILKGNFTVEDLLVPSYTLVEIQGKLTLKVATTNSHEIFGDADNPSTNVEIIGGELDGQKASQTKQGLYGINGAFLYSKFTNIRIHDFQDTGVHIQGHVYSSTDISKNVISYVQSYDNTKYGIFLEEATEDIITTCQIWNNERGILITREASRYCRRNLIYNNEISSNTKGISLEAYSFDVDGGMQDISIKQNVIFNNTLGIHSLADICPPRYTKIMLNDFIDNTADMEIGGGINYQPESIIKYNTGFITENSGTSTNAVNGTWVTHGCYDTPTVVSLTISGSNYINSTCYLLQPTVIASNSTMFQIGFYINNAGTITAVTATDQRNIMWTAEYEP